MREHGNASFDMGTTGVDANLLGETARREMDVVCEEDGTPKLRCGYS